MKSRSAVTAAVRDVIASISLLAASSVAVGDVSVVTQAASDWVYHGNSDTGGEPFIGINAEWQPNSRFFIGAEAHRARVPGVQQRHASVMLYLGTGWQLSEAWYASASLLRREFPGSAKEWDFEEFDIDLSHSSGWQFELDYSPDYYAHNTEALHGAVSFTREFGDRRYWTASAGVVDLSNDAFDGHRYLSVGTGLSRGGLNLDVSYVWNDGRGDVRFGDVVRSPGVVFQAAYRFR